MILISNGNINQLKYFVNFIVDEFDFMMRIEKKRLTFEMKRLTKTKCG